MRGANHPSRESVPGSARDRAARQRSTNRGRRVDSESTDNEVGGVLILIGETKEKPTTNERQILTDADGKPTHGVLIVESFQDMEELIEDLQEFYQMRDRL